MNVNSDCFQYSISWKGSDKHQGLPAFVKSVRSVVSILSDLSPVYREWFHLGSSRVKSLKNRVDFGNLQEEILNKNLKYKKQPAFGLTFSIWNGGDEDHDVNLTFRGLSESPLLDDFFSLRLPYDLAAIKCQTLVKGEPSLFTRLKDLRPTFCLFTSDHLMDCWRNLEVPGLPLGYRTLARSGDAYYERWASEFDRTEIDGYSLFTLSEDPSQLSQIEKMELARKAIVLGAKDAY